MLNLNQIAESQNSRTTDSTIWLSLFVEPGALLLPPSANEPRGVLPRVVDAFGADMGAVWWMLLAQLPVVSRQAGHTYTICGYPVVMTSITIEDGHRTS